MVVKKWLVLRGMDMISNMFTSLFFPGSGSPPAEPRVWRYVKPTGKNKEILAAPEVMRLWKTPEGSILCCTYVMYGVWLNAAIKFSTYYILRGTPERAHQDPWGL